MYLWLQLMQLFAILLPQSKILLINVHKTIFGRQRAAITWLKIHDQTTHQKMETTTFQSILQTIDFYNGPG